MIENHGIGAKAYVFFKLAADVSDETVAPLLRGIVKMPGVVDVGQVRPNSANASTRRQCFAQVTGKAQAGSVAEALQAMPEVETAAIPAQRFAIGDQITASGGLRH